MIQSLVVQVLALKPLDCFLIVVCFPQRCNGACADADGSQRCNRSKRFAFRSLEELWVPTRYKSSAFMIHKLTLAQIKIARHTVL